MNFSFSILLPHVTTTLKSVYCQVLLFASAGKCLFINSRRLNGFVIIIYFINGIVWCALRW